MLRKDSARSTAAGRWNCYWRVITGPCHGAQYTVGSRYLSCHASLASLKLKVSVQPQCSTTAEHPNSRPLSVRQPRLLTFLYLEGQHKQFLAAGKRRTRLIPA